MHFAELLGNERLKDNLTSGLRKGHVSHFYLISGPEGSGKHTLSRLLAAAIQCREPDRPCGRCISCRKILSGNHPDFITIDEPEKKTVPVELVRQAKADIYIKPNEGDYKIYCFPRADCLGIPGQNALLKVLEEPPEYGVFLLLTCNPDKLLPTVRSRCTELALQGLPAPVLTQQLRKDFPDAPQSAVAAAVSRSGGYLGQARKLLQDDGITPQTEGFVRCAAARDAVGLLQVLVPMEKWKRDALARELQHWLELTVEALAERSGSPAVSPLASAMAHSHTSRELSEAIGHLQTAVDYTAANVSPAAVCGYLAWNLR